VTLVFLLEEPSMRAFLEGLLPRVLPPGVQALLIAHEGKKDLERSLPRKLSAWRAPDARFVVVQDQDGADCRAVKAKLAGLCAAAGRPGALVRIACQELEAWFLGDLAGLGRALGEPRLGGLQGKAKYRQPDGVAKPSGELERLVPGYGKVKAARRMGPEIDVEAPRSRSFAVFLAGVRRLAEAGG
jgi:hypothetical protein